MATAKDFVDAARSCIGTRFHHQGRVKGAGLDCSGLVIVASDMVGVRLGDMKGYGRVPNGKDLLEHCDSQDAEKITIDEAKPGDIILMSFEKDPQHLLIVSEVDGEKISVVHAWMQPRKVVENVLPIEWRNKVVAVYRLRGLE